MAAASDQNDAVFAQNSVQIEFVDEVANVMERRESDEDLDDDFELVPEKDEANRTIPVPCVERNRNREWSRNINLRDDLDFEQSTGPRIEIEEDMKAVDFFFSDILLTRCGTKSWTRAIYTPSRREGPRNDQSGMP